jgi:hypothetical protein
MCHGVTVTFRATLQSQVYSSFHMESPRLCVSWSAISRQLKLDWLIPHASWLKYLTGITIETDLKIR